MGENGQNPDLCQHYKNPGGSSPTPALRTDQDQQDEEIPAVHEPEIFDIEDLPPDTPGLSLQSEVVKPYAVEEPDEESTSETEVSNTAQLRQRKHWEDLVSSMERLYCDSDQDNLGSIRPKRGRKRKPTTTNPVRTAQSGESAFVPDAQYASPSLSSKRARRKEELPKERYLDSDKEVIIRRPRKLSSSSNASVSTDTSGANLTNGFPIPESMDLD
ncbi:hypothetical protein BDW72DRAFT_3372 [Aspergillus terricola var. indicus]